MSGLVHSAPHQLVVGSPQHGVVRLATRIADAVALADPCVAVIRAATIDELLARVASEGLAGPAHLHVTDRLLGSHAIQAAEHFERLVANVSVSVTLHDLPQPSDGTGFARRIEGYQRLIAASTAVACNSLHEVRLIEENLGLETTGIAVIPLPVAPLAPASAHRITRREIAVLGFLYPGKGHAEVIDVVASMPGNTRPRVVALGATSPGHEADTERLQQKAAELGVEFEVTGFLDDADQIARCRAAAVAVVALQHVSASGSTATWIEAGRRPLVPDSRYAREVAALRPGTVTLYHPDSLAAAVRAALDDPASTWLAGSVDTRPHPSDTVAAYLAWWTEIAW